MKYLQHHPHVPNVSIPSKAFNKHATVAQGAGPVGVTSGRFQVQNAQAHRPVSYASYSQAQQRHPHLPGPTK